MITVLSEFGEPASHLDDYADITNPTDPPTSTSAPDVGITTGSA